MSFNSFVFLLAFLPVTLIIYWYLKGKGYDKQSLAFLVISSLFFYGYKNIQGLTVFLLSIAVNYIFATQIIKGNKKKLWMCMGVILDLIVLALFKYSAWFLLSTGISSDFLSLFGSRLTAPGISFYTFCEIAFLVEVYKGTIGKLNPLEYGFLMSFFPKMIQGPITRPGDLLPQISSESGLKNSIESGSENDIESGLKNSIESGLKNGLEKKHKISSEVIYRSLFLFILGCFKKVIIADTLGGVVDYGYSSLSSMHTGESLVIMLSYTLQLYFDFSGYCDMAMAISNLFGFELPLNFNSPYKAVDIEDFWKRWHITLTQFFTRYIYIPLGGNRKGILRMYINILIIFFVSGLWHGAGAQFIVWGLLHGVGYIVVRLVKSCKDSSSEGGKSGYRIVKALKITVTFLYVNVAWVFFRAPSLKDALSLFEGISEFWFPRFNMGLADQFNIEELWYIIKILRLDSFWWGMYILMFVILILLLILVFRGRSAVDYTKTCSINWINTGLMIVLFVWCLLSFEGVATYLYVNF